MVTVEMVANQFGQLQAAYARSNISFNYISTDWSVNDTWATDENGLDMKMDIFTENSSVIAKERFVEHPSDFE